MIKYHWHIDSFISAPEAEGFLDGKRYVVTFEVIDVFHFKDRIVIVWRVR